MLELPGAVFFVGMERDARGRWHRSGEWMQSVGFLRFCGWMWLRDARERWHRSGGGWVDAGGDVFEILRGGCG